LCIKVKVKFLKLKIIINVSDVNIKGNIDVNAVPPPYNLPDILE